MKYEVGQKVETPLGVGVVKGIRQYQEPIYQIKFMDSNFMVLDFEENELKPYKTPHERLLDMGYELIQGANLKIYRHDKLMNFRVYDDNTISCNEINLELSRILTDYLEWLEEEKWNII